MGDLVNLRRARKGKARAQTSARADERRHAFGRTKADRNLTEAERALEARRLDGHVRESVDQSDRRDR